MITSEIRKNIMNFYGLRDYHNYEMLKLEPDNMKIINKNTKKILDLRY